MNRLVVLDGNAILHRAYHALPPLNAPDGIPTNAVYGFVSMLLRLYKDLAPSHMAVAFDRPAPTFRKRLYAGYQATRPKMDDDLSVQVETAHDVVRALGIPIYEMDGYEADDLIGTIVAHMKYQIAKSKKNIPSQTTHRRSRPEDHVPDGGIDQAIIVTGDRDILQLVRNDSVYVYMPVKGLSQSRLYDEEKTKEKLGVAPEQVATLKALMGDSSDNYPGVSGIGPKTALNLIEAFGSIDNIYKALDRGDSRIPEVLKEKLRKGREDAFLSLKLATIKTDVPVDIGFSAMRVPTLDTPQARDILSRLSFHSLLNRLMTGVKNGKEGVVRAPKKTSKPAKTKDSTQMSLV